MPELATKPSPWWPTGLASPLLLRLPEGWELTDDAVLELCALNEEWRIEADGDMSLRVLPPAGTLTGARSMAIAVQLLHWSDHSGLGMVVGPALFRLPNGWRRWPHVAWISDERLATIDQNNEGIWPVCPDLVVEIRSLSDRLPALQEKMDMWIANGARLGWLIDPFDEQLHVYRPATDPKSLPRPLTLTDPALPALELDLTRIWRAPSD